MGSAIGQSLPIAVGVLISPMPIVALVLMLVSGRAKANGFAFLVGWVTGVFSVTLIVALLAGSTTSDDGVAPAWLSWTKIVLGLLLLLVGLRGWRTRPRGDSPVTAPAWMSSVDSFGPAKAAGLAFALAAINPKNLLLVVSGGAVIAAATTSTSDRIVSVVVFTVVASLGIATPLGLYLAMGERGTELLEHLKTWMIDNNAVIMAILMLVLGVKILGDGISGL